MAKKKPFGAIEAPYTANWLPKCVAMERGELYEKCKYCPAAGNDCINRLMERAADNLEASARNAGVPA